MLSVGKSKSVQVRPISSTESLASIQQTGGGDDKFIYSDRSSNFGQEQLKKVRSEADQLTLIKSLEEFVDELDSDDVSDEILRSVEAFSSDDELDDYAQLNQGDYTTPRTEQESKV